ncbi:MAG: nuclear transport factor 2 family protein [Chloroflexi bacterium]|nr:nuclear transport factor 2 family protein [Chloroflexota bacterium]
MTIEERVKALEDQAEIVKLKSRYCYFADKRDFKSFCELFTEDATLELGPLGMHKGRAKIREYMETTNTTMPWFAHMVHNPLIDVKGGEATGEWYFMVPCDLKGMAWGAGAGWLQGKYTERYVKIAEGWKIAYCKADFNIVSSHAKGWYEQKLQF